jgi:NADPH-dependent 2,4-dienoyl-CoA reductase/sulfur reductase-like enzyme/nitrite reductase/ring-hydroxylating ferredoxin subunit
MSGNETENEAPGPDLALGVALADLPEGRMIAGSFAGKPVVLVNDGGRVCAWSGTCTHLGAPLGEGLVVEGELRCPWHHARFALANGEAVGAPAFAPLTPYRTSESDGRIFVAAMPAHGEPGASAASGAPGETEAPIATPPVSATSAKPPQAASAPRVVIIGAGAGGHACAELLGRSGFAGAVTLISDDPDAPYDRTQCSKQYLIGMTSREECQLPPAAQATLRRERAQAIDVGARTVLLDTGERVPYDVLVLATGATPHLPHLPGFDSKNVHVLRTLKDADALIAAAKDARRVAIIGASFIGLEAAASLKQRKLEVHVIAPGDVPLKKLLGAEVGRMIRMVHEEQGVVFHLGRKPKSYDGGTLTLDDGSTLKADFVVVGTGVRPRTELAERAGIACAPPTDGGGVVVDERLETSVPGIFAIGDIARYPDVHLGKPLRVEHWVHAQRQGQHVARAILGEAGGYADLPFFWSAHFDTGLVYVGHVGSIVGTRVEGSIAGRDFAIDYTGAGEEKAFLTCNRDLPSLVTEAQWEGVDPGEMLPAAPVEGAR